MTLVAGSAVDGTGLAGAIARARKKAYGKKYSVKADAKAVDSEAAAIIEYLTSNTVVSVSGVTVGAGSANGTIS